MLVLTRRVGEAVIIEPKRELAGGDPLVWFTRPIEVRILRVEGKRVRIGIDAVDGLFIGRGEWREVGRGG